MKKISLISLFLASFLFISGALAADLVGPESSDDANVTISSAETHKNLYTAGGNVTVNGNVLGDLTAAGGMVTVEGNVEKDLIVAGGNLFINGKVGETARIAGGNISISAPIGGDLLVGGGNITISERSSVGGDLLVGGGNVNVNAPVKGSVKIGGGSVFINSKIEGDVKVKISKSLVFGPKADIQGKVKYEAPKPAVFKEGSKVPNAEFTKWQKPGRKGRMAGIITVAFLIKILAWILMGLVLVKLRKQTIQNMFFGIIEKPWENLGIGFLALIAAPILIILLLITAVGYYLAITAAMLYILLLLFACILSALFLGFLILKYLNKPSGPQVNWQAAVIGVV
ncbi:MAG: hypothetical protein NTX98_01340, partial [Candidatus Doudnabacteria bacterium]|nr:hypothetical protein [Candidatus Doudnabacteria bacterium]